MIAAQDNARSVTDGAEDSNESEGARLSTSVLLANLHPYVQELIASAVRLHRVNQTLLDLADTIKDGNADDFCNEASAEIETAIHAVWTGALNTLLNYEGGDEDDREEERPRSGYHVCPECSKAYKSPAWLNVHLRRHHDYRVGHDGAYHPPTANR